MVNSKFFYSLSFFLFLLAGYSAHGGRGQSLLQTAGVIEPGKYEAKLHADTILNHGGGFNISPHLRLGLVDPYIDLDTFIGTGTTDFQLGTLVKYNIFPDIPDQIGFSLNFGMSYLRDEGQNAFLFTFGPLASKAFLTSFGTLEPYAAFHFEGLIRGGDNESEAPLTLIGGSKFGFKDWKWTGYAELSANINESVWMLTLGAGYNY